MLHILEKTEEGRSALQEVLGPLQHLQYLQRSVRQHELDLDALSRSLEERPWDPYTAFGLRYHPPHSSSSKRAASSKGHGHPQHKSAAGALHGSLAAAVAAANAAAEAAQAAADVATEMAAAGRALRAAESAGAASGDGSSSGGASVDGEKSSSSSSHSSSSRSGSSSSGGSSRGNPRLRLREKVVRGSKHTDELQAELTRRKEAVAAEAEALQPRVEAMLGRLRDLLHAAANSSGLAPGSTVTPQGSAAQPSAAGDQSNDIVADPNDLDLYELILPRCVLARLDPANYVSYPARPFVSVVLSYSGRRLPFALYEVAEPLLACAAGMDLPPWPGEEGGSSNGGGGGDGEGPLGEPLPPLPLEILVAFDEVSEAAGWAAAAADSGGRIIPVFRPGVDEVIVGSSSEGSGSSSSGSSSSSTGWSAGSPPPLVHWANRVAQLAQGELLVVVQDGDSLLSSDGHGDSSSTSRRVCSWLHMALRAFEAWPQLGALGSGAYVMDWHPAAINRGQHFWDGERRLLLQFVAAALATPQAAEPRGGAVLPAAPIAVRRAAWRQLGGLDAGLGAAAACGACAWLDMSTRLWLGGWQKWMSRMDDLVFSLWLASSGRLITHGEDIARVRRQLRGLRHEHNARASAARTHSSRLDQLSDTVRQLQQQLESFAAATVAVLEVETGGGAAARLVQGPSAPPSIHSSAAAADPAAGAATRPHQLHPPACAHPLPLPSAVAANKLLFRGVSSEQAAEMARGDFTALGLGEGPVGQLPLDLGSSSPAANSLLLPLDARRRRHLAAATARTPDVSGIAHTTGEAAAVQGGAHSHSQEEPGFSAGQPADSSEVAPAPRHARALQEALAADAQAGAAEQAGPGGSGADAGAGGAGGPHPATSPGVAPGREEEEAAWCERPELAAHRGRLEGVCARLLQLRYGTSPYWHDGSPVHGEGEAARAKQQAAQDGNGGSGSDSGEVETATAAGEAAELAAAPVLIAWMAGAGLSVSFWCRWVQ
ncbi:hypothetical protein HXX76_003222 [Chlamydomonas incerta]|uniref:Uncharacterized protein n=1 Tax=Chlamydomonas incerta TaxID=51695 RepID=A0A835TDB9_CHLIN|nr:hypothetical protein HXX76_003222 [Chlamydomonas incerta]|eukprot:KAG2441602.1 hypothetical protein HXX76_003222 [Chlamydomonas incerta]